MITTTFYGPPGTGKTHSLKNVVEEFGKPVLCLSFTRSASRELAERGVGASASTLHSLAYKALDLGSAQVVDRGKLEGLTKVSGIPFSSGMYDDYATSGDEYMSLISLAKATFQSLESVSKRVSLGTANEFLWFAGLYREWKRGNYFVDFDDMILGAQQDKYLDGLKMPHNKGLIIDEAQDLTPAQWVLIDKIIKMNDFEKIWVAGDDDQAIFSWAGADPQGMPKFSVKYGGSDIILSKSWRIPLLVHRLAEALIQRINNRVVKEYQPRDESGEVNRLFSLHDSHKYDAILYRNHSIGIKIANELRELGIPYEGKAVRSAMTSKKARTAISYLNFLEGAKMTPKVIEDIKRNIGRYDLDTCLSKQIPWSRVIQMDFAIKRDLMIIQNRFGKLNKVKPVILSSMHQYKGKEENSVLVVDGMNDRTQESMVYDRDSEYRVFYVAVTRAKHKLGIIEWDNPLGLSRM